MAGHNKWSTIKHKKGAADAKRGSRAQLLATLTTLREALFGDPGRLDRDLWLARLADLLIDAVIPPDQTALLERARDEIRKGTVQLSLRGFSHVFLHSADAGQPDTQSMRAPVEISTPAIAVSHASRTPPTASAFIPWSRAMPPR